MRKKCILFFLCVSVLAVAWSKAEETTKEKVKPTTRLFPVEGKNHKWGYADGTGKIVIAPQFNWAFRFSDGLARVTVGQGWAQPKFGYIDHTGKMVIKPQFDYWTRDFSDGLARVMIDWKWGYIDKTGKVAIRPQFDVAFDFSDGLARVVVDGKWGFIDKAGKHVVNTTPDPEKTLLMDLYKRATEYYSCMAQRKFRKMYEYHTPDMRKRTRYEKSPYKDLEGRYGEHNKDEEALTEALTKTFFYVVKELQLKENNQYADVRLYDKSATHEEGDSQWQCIEGVWYVTDSIFWSSRIEYDDM